MQCKIAQMTPCLLLSILKREEGRRAALASCSFERDYPIEVRGGLPVQKPDGLWLLASCGKKMLSFCSGGTLYQARKIGVSSCQ